MNIARPAYAGPTVANPDRTRSPRVRAREAERRTARAAKLSPTPFDAAALEAELHAVGVAR